MRGLSKSAGVSPFVSRGGIKLAAAFDAFGLDPKASSRSIIGASTGGFTEVLLECGAAQVFTVDVGSDQLHAKLRGNPRVVALGKDRCAGPRRRGSSRAPSAPSSPIELQGAALRLAAPDAWLVALVTPQFEAGRRLWAKASSSVRRKRAPRPWRRYGPLSTRHRAGRCSLR
jgi:23S rRNA (cytidine1920-2'-O)/16S rRNA (cytidine1409-2'-O)-methyltransferase